MHITPIYTNKWYEWFLKIGKLEKNFNERVEYQYAKKNGRNKYLKSKSL